MTDVLSQARVDLYSRITDEIIRAIEGGAGAFIMPWHGIFGRPRNAATGAAYQGINTLVLWASARNRGYSSWYWATYRQWHELGAHVVKGEKATPVVLYKQVPVKAEDAETGEPVGDYRAVIRMFFVFNGEQVEGWNGPASSPARELSTHGVIQNFMEATGADIRYGDMAAYHRAKDIITIPDKSRFIETPTSSPLESYYSTVFHELVHWSGAHWRLDRNLSGRFGTHDYAMEELVAELGAAYLCAEFLVLHEPRKDHAAYIGEWLEVLKGDKRAIFAAASKASQAVTFLLAS